jgi:hypothetical protein
MLVWLVFVLMHINPWLTQVCSSAVIAHLNNGAPQLIEQYDSPDVQTFFLFWKEMLVLFAGSWQEDHIVSWHQDCVSLQASRHLVHAG